MKKQKIDKYLWFYPELTPELAEQLGYRYECLTIYDPEAPFEVKTQLINLINSGEAVMAVTLSELIDNSYCLYTFPQTEKCITTRSDSKY